MLHRQTIKAEENICMQFRCTHTLLKTISVIGSFRYITHTNSHQCRPAKFPLHLCTTQSTAPSPPHTSSMHLVVHTALGRPYVVTTCVCGDNVCVW
eukprot:m.3659 g.3659  ORF g.3659 m.3659 type:complete len:96 (-) comp2954_c0_seq1:42-329(-)